LVSPYNLTSVVDPANIGEDTVGERHLDGHESTIFKQKTLKYAVIGDINSHDLAMVVNIRRKGC